MNFFKKVSNGNLFNSSKSLTVIANELETDKGTADKSILSWGNDWPEHFCWGYTNTYEKYMQSHRENSNVKLFEIGICDKRFPYASPKMWLTYFKDVNLYCVDNFWGNTLDDRMDEVKMLNELGVNFIYADQGNFIDWSEIKNVCPNDFDFFIEDGSHWPNHMAVSLWQSIDLVKSGGYYFMEDLQHPMNSRGKFKYDNSLLTQELLVSLTTNRLHNSFLNDKQNDEVNSAYELIELVLDPTDNTYLAVFKKR
jgi:hypothetical protein